MSETDALSPGQAEIRTLIEEVHQLQELQAHPGWAVLMRYTHQWLGAHEDRMRSGQIDDLNEYKLTAGRADGVRQVIELPGRVERMLESAKLTDNWVDEFGGSDDPAAYAAEELLANDE